MPTIAIRSLSALGHRRKRVCLRSLLSLQGEAGRGSRAFAKPDSADPLSISPFQGEKKCACPRHTRSQIKRLCEQSPSQSCRLPTQLTIAPSLRHGRAVGSNRCRQPKRPLASASRNGTTRVRGGDNGDFPVNGGKTRAPPACRSRRRRSPALRRLVEAAGAGTRESLAISNPL